MIVQRKGSRLQTELVADEWGRGKLRHQWLIYAIAVMHVILLDAGLLTACLPLTVVTRANICERISRCIGIKREKDGRRVTANYVAPPVILALSARGLG